MLIFRRGIIGQRILEEMSDQENVIDDPIEDASVIETPTMSKNQFKKQLKKERWEATRGERAVKRKEKRLRQKTEKASKNDLDDVNTEHDQQRPSKKFRSKKSNEPIQWSPISVCIDATFDDKMTEGEIVSFAGQIKRCYSANRFTEHPVHLSVCGIRDDDSKVKARWDRLDPQHVRWSEHIKISTENFEDHYTDKAKLVYLTPDSENTLTHLDDDKVYIIGGIVDKNRHKSLCFNKALEMGIETAKLPIEEYIQMSSRKVLTVNHVFDIIIKFLEQKQSNGTSDEHDQVDIGEYWKTAFNEVIPQRKLNDKNNQ